MWQRTQMVVLSAVTAALFAALLIPFKGLQIVPGFSELRPAAIVPVLFGWMFGPAGAWGAAFGNLIGDFFGTLGVGSLFGMVGNFAFSMTAYKLFDVINKTDETNSVAELNRTRVIIGGALSALTAAATCGLVIGWGVDMLKLVPFSFLAGVIFMNNSLFAVIVAPFLYLLLYRRVARLGLIWRDLLPPEDRSRRPMPKVGSILIMLGSFGGLAAGVYLSTMGGSEPGSWLVTLGLIPFMALILIGYLLA